MGVKSTITLTREEAEKKYVELMQREEARRFRAQAAYMDKSELEFELERLDDKLSYSGESFNNYLIVPDKD
jgi:hypothetical protein